MKSANTLDRCQALSTIDLQIVGKRLFGLALRLQLTDQAPQDGEELVLRVFLLCQALRNHLVARPGRDKENDKNRIDLSLSVEAADGLQVVLK